VTESGADGAEIDHIDRAYKAIGEFVVTFQWIENKYREIGWLILDPDRSHWPPMALRTESNRVLVDKVTALFCDLVEKYDLPTGPERRDDMLGLQKLFHELRRYRNGLLHSTFTEVKAGREVIGILRSNPNPLVDTETGEIYFENETFTEEVILKKIASIAEASFRLGQHYVQLIHWTPFERFKRS
jgi:hypothetical protein